MEAKESGLVMLTWKMCRILWTWTKEAMIPSFPYRLQEGYRTSERDCRQKWIPYVVVLNEKTGMKMGRQEARMSCWRSDGGIELYYGSNVGKKPRERYKLSERKRERVANEAKANRYPQRYDCFFRHVHGISSANGITSPTLLFLNLLHPHQATPQYHSHLN